MGECYFCCGHPDISCNGECQEPYVDISELEAIEPTKKDILGESWRFNE